jgi:2-iminoacetate synthase
MTGDVPMSFVDQFDQLPLGELASYAAKSTAADVEAALARTGSARVRLAPNRRSGLEDFAVLVSPAAGQPQYLEAMARGSHELTVRHFGRVIRLFAPLYLSNECINICKYCGFSRDNPILRVTLTIEQVMAEARFLREQGFRHILLVAGEHPHFVSGNYLRDCAARLHPEWPSISLEVGPMEADEYVPIVQAGAEGLVVYQETYDRTVYAAMHASDPKKNFDWRLETPERAYAAGFKRLGIGALLGLAPWRSEAIPLAAHLEYLLKKCWTAQVTVSVPRLRPAAGEFQPLVDVSDRDLVQFVCALRLTFPEVGIVLSTRESAKLRDGLVPLGVTMMSAGSHTEPGGYTGQGTKELHLTKGGHLVKPPLPLIESEGEHATVQFEIADNRTPPEVAICLEAMGYDPVWKDWDAVLNES